MSGDSLDAGREALEAEIVSFSPGRLRGVVSSLLAMMDDLEAKEAAKIKGSIDAMKSGVGTTSTNSPASSESIPPSGRSENLLAQRGG
jgi:hypothetical protein